MNLCHVNLMISSAKELRRVEGNVTSLSPQWGRGRQAVRTALTIFLPSPSAVSRSDVPVASSGSPRSRVLSAPLRQAPHVTRHVRSADPTALHRRRMAAQRTVSGSVVRRVPLGLRRHLKWPCRTEAGSVHSVNRHSAGAAVVQGRCPTPGSGVGFTPDV